MLELSVATQDVLALSTHDHMTSTVQKPKECRTK
jgi:hypothetical protein